MLEIEAKELFCHAQIGCKYCVGSACMAWRWNHIMRKKGGSGLQREEIPSGERTGYCGLAGKP